MSVVVDASVATKWLTPEEGTEAALTLLGTGEVLHAPDLIYAEVARALARKEQRGEIERDLIHEALASLVALPLETRPSRGLILRAAALVSQSNLTVYDCHYLALASQLGASLATADRALRRAANHMKPTPVPIWQP